MNIRPIDTKNMSKHFLFDRRDRLERIERVVGWGEPIAEVLDFNTGATKVLTDTGVVIIRAISNNMIITAWIAEEAQANRIYREAHFTSMPQELRAKVIENNKVAA